MLAGHTSLGIEHSLGVHIFLQSALVCLHSCPPCLWEHGQREAGAAQPRGHTLQQNGLGSTQTLSLDWALLHAQ